MAKKKQIVILGGGIAALTTAWYLSDQPGWQDRYDITVYQLGWRLGGKCASSRNAERHWRSEEHGLHIWPGFYANAFGLLGNCYRELGGDVRQHFRGQDHVCMLDPQEQPEQLWSVYFKPDKDFPGLHNPEPSLALTLRKLLDLISGHFGKALQEAHALELQLPADAPDWLRRLLQARPMGGPEATAPETPLSQAQQLLARQQPLWQHDDAQHRHIAQLLRDFRDPVVAWLGGARRRMSRARKAIELGCCIAIGCFFDGVLRKGLSAIDRRDFRDWLLHHGAHRETVDWAPVQVLYDSPFAYVGGDTEKGANLAAGVALGVALRLGLTYRGHLFYDMQGGMGDVVITPLYRALEARGVRFEFFHRVRRLELKRSAGGHVIRSIHFGRQARLKCGIYRPLVTVPVLGEECWPDRPRYEQLVEGDRIRDGGHDLESHWDDWTTQETEFCLDLQQGDQVVLGISLGALKTICAELCAVDPDWRALVNGLPTVQTQGVQLWLSKSGKQIGWKQSGGWIVTAPQPHSVVADMSHVQEDWNPPPGSVQYLCGPLQGDYLAQYPAPDPAVPARARQQVHDETVRWLECEAKRLWPGCVDPKTGGFDWKLLLDADGLQGPARLGRQYLRPNINPSDRYVLSPAGTPKLRLSPDNSGFDNLVLSGDWTRTAMNVGCVEAAVMSGMAAARALCGHPRKIHGEFFLQA
ncbi:MAG TPA: NAD(P)-binding protein [Solimonas sp.]|nr:NAD(P)-binding protein [Solimonas sp.]